jgi:SAM-dependent methyltransferase
MDLQMSHLRTAWVQTGHRRRLTRALEPRIAALRGRVLDVGGGREAPHDDAWKPDARRIRIDLAGTHRPDLQGDAASLPFSDETFDSVVMIEVMEHLPAPAAAAAEVARILRPGGVFLGSAPFIWPVHGDPQDYFRFSADGLQVILGGFSQQQIVPIGNAAGSAWLLVSNSSRTLRVFNPLLRRLGERPDPRAPEGYVFTAIR